MADAISLNPNINNAQNIDLGTAGAQNTTAPVQNNKSQNSIFANSSLNATTNDYSNDLMMANLNFSSIPTEQTQQATNQSTLQSQTPQSTQQSLTSPQFTSNGQATDALTGCLADKNTNKKSNIGKMIGGIGGFFAPIAGKIYGLCKGQSVKALFDFKQLAITCPLIGAAGLGIGVLVDSYLDTQNVKKASQPTPSQAQQLVA